MSISRAEFLRLLPGAVEGAPTQLEAGVFIGDCGPGHWRISLEPLADHRLGSVSLPSQRVVVCVEGCSPEAGEAFLAQFLRGFQRGGG